MEELLGQRILAIACGFEDGTFTFPSRRIFTTVVFAPKDKLDFVLAFLRTYRWREREFGITPFAFIHALRGLTNKAVGRGKSGTKTYRTLMAAGMHFMDRYNYDVERVKRCVILYSTPDGVYPFCTINGGPEYRPYLEGMIARSSVGSSATLRLRRPCPT